MKRFFGPPTGKGKSLTIIILSAIGLLILSLASSPRPQLIDLDLRVEQYPVTYNGPFQLHFSQRMNQASVEAAFELSPKVEGKFSWPNSKTMEFKPQQDLRIEDEYQLILKQEAKSIWGKRMGVDTHLEYLVTGPPFLLFQEPAPETLIKKNQALTFMFDRAMALEGLNQEKLIELEPKIEGDIKLIGKSAFQFIPKKLNPGTDYHVKLLAGLPAKGGGKTEESYEWTFRNPENRVLSTQPAEGELVSSTQALRLEFEHSVDLAQVRPGNNALLYPSNDLPGEENESSLKEDGFFNTEVRYAENEEGESLKNVLIFTPEFPYQTDLPHQFLLKANAGLGLEEDFYLSFIPQKEDVMTEKDDSENNEDKPNLAWETESQIEFFVQGEKPFLRLKEDLTENVTLSICQFPSAEFIRTQTNGGFQNYSCPEEDKEIETSKDVPTRVIEVDKYFPQDWSNGVYFVSLNNGEEKIWRIFLIQDAALLLKRSQNDLLVWANDLKTGEALANTDLEFLSSEGEVLATGTTDEHGLYFNEGVLAQGVWARVKNEDGSQINPWGLVNEYWSPYLKPQEKREGLGKAIFFVNQNQFDPGEKLKLAGFYRVQNHQALSLSSEGNLRVILMNTSNESLLEEKLSLGKNGFFFGELEVPQELLAGSYTLQIIDTEDLTLSEAYPIRIGQQTEPLEFKWLNPKKTFSAGSLPELNLRVEQNNGLAIPNLKANYKLFQSYLADDLPKDYFFGSVENLCMENCEQKKLIKMGDIEFNREGEARLELRNETESFLASGYQYELEVSSEEGHQANSHNRFIFEVRQGEVQIGVKVGHAISYKQEAIEAEFMVLNQQSQPVESIELNVNLLNPKERGGSVFKKNLHYETGGVNRLVIPLKNNWEDGAYLLRVEGKDRFKNTIRAEKEIYVTKGMNESLSSQFFVAADQNLYQVGGRADLIINEKSADPRFPVPVLITYERDGIFAHQWMELSSPVTPINVPIEANMAPYFEVKVIKFKNGSLAEYETKRQRIYVENQSSELKLSLSTEPKNPKPGDKVKLILQSRDFQDRPIPARLSLNLIEGQANYPKINYSNFFKTLLSNDSEASNIGLMGEGQRNVKNKEENTAAPFHSIYFQHELETDKNGQAFVDFTLPEQGAEFNYFVAALADENRFGSLEGSLNDELEFSLESILPNFVMAGDQTNLSVLVKNNAAEKATTRVEIKVDKAVLKGDQAYNVSLNSGEQKMFHFPIVVNENLNEQMLRVSFYWEGHSISKTIPVKHLAHVQDVVEDGYIQSLWTGRVYVPKTAYPETGWLHFALSGGPTTSLKSLLNQISGKDETLYETYLELLGLAALSQTEWNQNQANILVNTLFKKMNDEGAYAYWNPNYSEPIFTAKVLNAFAFAKERGLELDEEKLNQSMNYLFEKLTQEDLSIEDQLFVLWALARHRQYDTQKVLELYQQREQTGFVGQGFLLMNLEALRRAGQTGIEPFITKLEKELKDAAIVVDDKTYFNEAKRKNHASAVVLYGLLQTKDERGLMDGIARYLVSRKIDWWQGNTEENIWKLLALREFAETKQTDHSNFIAQVKLNGKVIMDQSIQTSSGYDVSEMDQSAGVLNAEAVNELFVKKEGNASLYFDGQLNSYLNPLEVESSEKGVILVREISRQSIKKGDQVNYQLLVVVPKDLEAVVIESPNPAAMRTLGGDGLDPDSPFDHVEVSEEGITYYATHLPAGVYELNYQTQALLAGSYHQLPAHLRSLTDARIQAQTSGNLVNVME